MAILDINTVIVKRYGRAFYVGGSVRDELLGLTPSDFDIEIFHLTTKELESVLAQFGTVNAFGAQFGIYKLTEYPEYDFSLPRTETKTGEKHVDFLIHVQPDLDYRYAAERRDFTMNALMKEIGTNTILDYFNGIADIENKMIRHINSKTFIEDPLRALRAAQFAARFSFQIAPDTQKLIRSMSLVSLSHERIYQENKKGFLSQNPQIYFIELLNLNIFQQLYNMFPPFSSIHIEELYSYLKESITFQNRSLILYSVLISFYTNNSNGFFNYFLESNRERYVAKRISQLIILLTHESDKQSLRRIKSQLYTLNEKEQDLFFSLIQLLLTNESNILEFKTFESFQQSWTDAIQNNPHNSPLVQGRDLITLGFQPGKNFKLLLDEALQLEIEGNTKDKIIKKIQEKSEN